jgi:hypothetical protein
VIAKPAISGNAIITHSTHDMAVGWAYPAASLVLGQVASGVAAFNPFGGIGADGAVTTPEAVFEHLNEVGTPYAPLPAKIIVRNLRGNQFIAVACSAEGPPCVIRRSVSVFDCGEGNRSCYIQQRTRAL